MKLFFTGDIKELKAGLSYLAEDYGYELAEGGVSIAVTKTDKSGLCVKRDGNKGAISYGEKVQFFRALGLFLQESAKSDQFELCEDCMFKMNGAMFDVSQGNAVMRVSVVKDYLKRMAVMGLNMLMLYSEDSYEVKNQPYFGYMRSKYTEEELRECDDYAYDLGIEMIPCIQTLAHFIDVLKWDTYHDMRDDFETILVGSEKAYRFVEDLIASACRPFRTKRIHIGMDEAWHLGLGNYLGENGYRRKFDIMNEHLARVMEIVKKYDLEPMIWSDMYFRAANPAGAYYSDDAVVPREIAEKVPNGVQLVYWDYYHYTEEFYRDFLNRHRVFKEEPIFAGGIWTWTGFAPNWKKTFGTTNPALMACKNLGIKEVFATIWGDNGTECNVYTNLLGLQLFAEHGYSRELNTEKLKERFAFCTGANYDDFWKLHDIDDVPRLAEKTPEGGAAEVQSINASKFLIWQDILSGLFDKNIENSPLTEHYEKLTTYFGEAKTRNDRYNSIFELAEKLCSVLSLKAMAGVELYRAYHAGDKTVLADYAQNKLPELIRRVNALRNCHKDQWFEMNKAFGWDILDIHYGGLLMRAQCAVERLNDYLSGKVEKLAELEEARLSYTADQSFPQYNNFYGKICSASRIAAEA